FTEVVVQAARAVAEAGFTGVELPLPHAEFQFNRLRTADWKQLGSLMTDAGAPARSIHGPTFAPLETPCTQAIDRLMPYVEIAQTLEVSALVVHPTPHSHPHVCPIAEALLERDAQISQAIAQEIGPTTKLAIENLPTYGLAHLRRLMDRVADDRVGVCFDTGHWMVRPEGNIEDAVRDFAPRLAHVHLSDNDGRCDAHRPPGAGAFPWRAWWGAMPPSWSRRAMLVELSLPLRRDREDAPQRAKILLKEAQETARRTLVAAELSHR
ncbi:MAG: sugar phosphate isomerase/epimerase family protein, partial [Planctomycetota bacterium]